MNNDDTVYLIINLFIFRDYSQESILYNLITLSLENYTIVVILQTYCILVNKHVWILVPFHTKCRTSRGARVSSHSHISNTKRTTTPRTHPYQVRLTSHPLRMKSSRSRGVNRTAPHHFACKSTRATAPLAIDRPSPVIAECWSEQHATIQSPFFS